MNDSFSTAERGFVTAFRRRFAQVTSPIVRLLAALHVSPNAVSGSQVVIGVAIAYLLGPAPAVAVTLFLLTLVIDGLDGALARTYGQSSQFGALFDQVCDHVRETLMIAGLAAWGLLHPFPAVMYGLVYALFNFMLFLCNNRGAPVPWAVKSYMVVYVPLGLYGYFGINVLTPAVSVCLVFMLFTVGLALRNVRTVMG